MKQSSLTILTASILIFTSSSLFAQNAEQIVRRADERRDYETTYMEARMVNTDQFGEKTIEYVAWAKGANFLMEFTSDAEFGQRILRDDGRIYHFFPDSETVFTRGQGDSIVGLISYDDVTNEDGLLENYNASLEGEESLNGTPVYRVRLEAKPRTRVAYPNQLIWVEKESSIIRRVEMYTRTVQPLKTMEIREVTEVDGIAIATDILITDEVRRDVTSEIFIEEIEVGISIPDSRFTRRALTQ
ncbi:MAG: outer membrane lipoprotein-sorting protein [Spirochaetota bacterium]